MWNKVVLTTWNLLTMKPKGLINENNHYLEFSSDIRASLLCRRYSFSMWVAWTENLYGYFKRLAQSVCACMCASHFLCDLLECERSHSETHTDSAWSNSQHGPLCIIRSAYHSSSAASHIIPQHIMWLFLHAILTLTYPTTAPFPAL